MYVQNITEDCILDLTGNNTHPWLSYNISRFPDGQQNISVELSKIPHSVCIFYYLSTFIDLELIICANQALKLQGVKEVSLYTPYFMGARSDRRFSASECNYLRDVICPIIRLQNFEHIYVVDPHSDVLEACLPNLVKIDNTDLLKYTLDKINNYNKYCIISPDAGASKKIYKLLEKNNINLPVIVCSKDRDINGKLTKTIVPDDVKKYRNFLIIDDICDGGSTFLNIAEVIKEKVEGAVYLELMVTHGIFSKGVTKLLKKFKNIYTTNSFSQLDYERINVTNLFKKYEQVSETSTK